jgi:ATP-dependent Clp protease ATP-binding subunit ClpA
MFERFTDQAKLSLALAFREARALHHNYIGTEHVLLGLLRVAERNPHGEFAATTLSELGLDPATAHERALAEVRQILRGSRPSR